MTISSLRRLCVFTITIYVKAWFSATDACNAPCNDLLLLQTLESFEAIDSLIAQVALQKLKGHLWYLSKDLVCLTLFSDHVWDEEKRKIVLGLQKPCGAKDLRRFDAKGVRSFQSMALSDFVSERSRNLFTALKLDTSFLSVDPTEWKDRPDFSSALQTVKALRVVNDCAERAVKLATDFNQALTRDEEQRQLLFQVVEYHRNKVTEPLKKNYAK